MGQFKPTYRVGNKVLFQHPETCDFDWLKGEIVELVYDGEYFLHYLIEYRGFGSFKKSVCKLFNENWIKPNQPNSDRTSLRVV